MPSDDYFRCPACNAKLKFGKRPKSRVTCPRCGHPFDYKAPEADAETVPAAKPQDELGSTAAFGMALQEATGQSRQREPVDESDEMADDFVEEPGSESGDEYGQAVAPLRPRKTVARAAKEPPEAIATTPKPFTKRLRKWYKRSWLGNPSTAGWQIAAGYAGIGVLVLVVLLCVWMRQLQGQAKEDRRISYANIYQESSSNVSNLVLTGAFSLGTLFCLPIPYWLWIGSNIGRLFWLLVRGAGYIGALVVLHRALSDESAAAAFGLMALLVVAAIGNIAGCVLLTTWEGSVGRTLFAIVLIVVTELTTVGLFVKNSTGSSPAPASAVVANFN
jgi:hypothetical protein